MWEHYSNVEEKERACQMLPFTKIFFVFMKLMKRKVFRAASQRRETAKALTNE